MISKRTNIKLSSPDSCTGCGACAQSCVKEAITMVENMEGFLQPRINSKLCVECHKCEKVCPILNPIVISQNLETKVYAAINKDDKVRVQSSSGGAFYALAKWTIEQGGVVFGAKFIGIHLQHDCAEKLEDVYPFMGSKYIQSDVADSYDKVKSYLLQDRLVLYSGTPCQIAGLKRFLYKDYENLITVDLLCHGVPSPRIWERYMRRLLNNLKAKEVKDIRFRTKRRDLNISPNFYFFFFFLGEDGVWHEYGEDCRKNLYFAYFMRHLFRSSCYHCHFRSLETSQADFTIGDCWNVDEDHPKMSDGQGISTIILHTNKASQILFKLKNAFIFENEDIAIMQKRYEEAKREEQNERECRLWKLSNYMAQIIPLDYMQIIYKHDRWDYVLRRKLKQLWQKNIK